MEKRNEPSTSTSKMAVSSIEREKAQRTNQKTFSQFEISAEIFNQNKIIE